MLGFALLALLFFGILVVFYSFREERLRKQLGAKDRLHNQQLYQISLLTQIQDRIGYELHKEKVIDVILDNLEKFFSYTTASTLLLKEGKLRFKAHVAKPVSRSYIMEIRRSMIATLSTLAKKDLPLNIDEELLGLPLDDTQTASIQSSFHIPFAISGITVGLITLTSTIPNHFSNDDSVLLEKLTYQAAHALTKLEEVLAAEEGKLMALIRSLTDGVFMVDTNSQILLINDAGKSILGLEKERIEMLDILRALPRDYDLIEKIHEAISEKKTVEDRGITISDKTVQIFITPVIDTRTLSVLGLSILLHDSTLEENMARMKRDFINMIIHELRAPTTAIKDSAKLMIQSKDTLPKETQTRLLEIIHTQAGMLLDQVSSLLDAAKMEEHRLVLNRETANLERVIIERLEIFKPQAQRKRVTLNTHLHGNLPMMYIDTIRIGQVINNLVSNSLKFTPEGGAISVSTTVQDSNTVQVTVADTGVGIPKEKQSQLFRKFSQIGTPPSPTIDPGHGNTGTGLGLFIVKGIIEAHGGIVRLDSGVDRGTTITFTLPIHAQEQAEEVLAQDNPPPSQIFKTSVN